MVRVRVKEVRLTGACVGVRATRQGRCRGDAGEIQGIYRGDTGEIQGRYRGGMAPPAWACA